MNKIPVDQAFIETARIARDKKGITNKAIAEAVKKQEPWVSKFFGGAVKSITFRDMESMEKLLDDEFFGLNRAQTKQSALARKIAGAVDSDDKFAKIASLLHESLSEEKPHIPEVHQKELIKIGAELTRIVMRWECAADPHYAKIAGESLDYLRDYMDKRKPRK